LIEGRNFRRSFSTFGGSSDHERRRRSRRVGPHLQRDVAEQLLLAHVVSSVLRSPAAWIVSLYGDARLAHVRGRAEVVLIR
jgi:hypothetical protein